MLEIFPGFAKDPYVQNKLLVYCLVFCG